MGSPQVLSPHVPHGSSPQFPGSPVSVASPTGAGTTTFALDILLALSPVSAARKAVFQLWICSEEGTCEARLGWKRRRGERVVTEWGSSLAGHQRRVSVSALSPLQTGSAAAYPGPAPGAFPSGFAAAAAQSSTVSSPTISSPAGSMHHLQLAGGSSGPLSPALSHGNSGHLIATAVGGAGSAAFGAMSPAGSGQLYGSPSYQGSAQGYGPQAYGHGLVGHQYGSPAHNPQAASPRHEVRTSVALQCHTRRVAFRESFCFVVLSVNLQKDFRGSFSGDKYVRASMLCTLSRRLCKAGVNEPPLWLSLQGLQQQMASMQLDSGFTTAKEDPFGGSAVWSN